MNSFFPPWIWGSHWPKPTVETQLNDDLGTRQAAAYDSAVGEGGSEVVSHFDGRLYVTNGESDKIDVIDAVTGALLMDIDLSTLPGYDGVNSVAASSAGIVAAVETDGTTGIIAKYAFDGSLMGTVSVGNLPDMVTFSKDDTRIFVANEGERDGASDPAGSISVIDVATMQAQTFGFGEFDSQVDALRDAGVRIFPGTLPSTDFEPEFIAEAGGNLFVTVQEAASVAIFDLASMSWDKIVPLGTIDHSVTGLDANDRDGKIDIRTYDNLVGLRMADAIAATEIDGKVYFLTANEGDDRGDAPDGDAARIGDILDPGLDPGEGLGVTIDPSVDTTGLERLTISVIDGDTDGDGDIDILHAYGSRSFTIFDADGAIVFDSGDDFEQIIAANRVSNAFNNDAFPTDDPDVVDENRSDNKGPEPEAMEIGVVDGKTLAFIGLERDGGIMIYDISDPANAAFADYIDSSLFGHASPEVIDFIAAEDSGSGLAQIAVSYEISGTTAVYDLQFGADIVGTLRADDIQGTIGGDTIEAGAGRDTVDGNASDDLIRGGFGRDMLFGSAGDDDLRGGFGRDTIIGGVGDDSIKGGAGADRFVFALGDGLDTITDLSRHDKIDLRATGLDFDDLAIIKTGDDRFTVDYGDHGDSVDVTLAGKFFLDLGEDSFLL